MEKEQIIAVMSGRRLFEGASPQDLGDLVDHGEVVSIKKGDHMIEQGKIGEAVWVLLDGKVSVIENESEPQELDSPGTILGEISAISHTAATATVRAASDLSALRIPHRNFHTALTSSQKLASSVLRSMSKYLN
ncbi:MAG: cyclic nucleotide-binding domain-containing protein [Verrucomicrobiales bacterium]|nr:cyclic nucleotide-binding domain-containing protein [Verrucomicrobiales bacterium]